MNTTKPIDGFLGYHITTSGKVYSERTQKMLKPWLMKIGYRMVALRRDGQTFHNYVHRLVAQAFIDKPAGQVEVNHIDGDRQNNHQSNLEWVTRSENNLNASRRGTMSKKLIESDVRMIRAIRKIRGFTYKVIGQMYGVSDQQIYQICKGKSWSWLA